MTPALAVIEEFQKDKDTKIYFFGRKFAMEGDKNPSIESVTIEKLGIPFYPITTGRLQRRFSRYTLPSLVKIPYGLVQSLNYLKQIKPDVVVSFGGYLAVPVVMSAKLLNIPSITHEQTVVSGLANRIIGRFSTKIAVSWESSINHFPGEKVVLTGNPIRGELLKIKRHKVSRPVLYFTGGNQGARIINESVLEILPELLEIFEVYHQTGASQNSEDLIKAKEVVSQLPESLRSRYHVDAWFDTETLTKILSKVTLVISRCGANTVTELASIGIPSILIPIPWVTGDEQTKNARLLEENGTAIILRQAEVTPKKLFTTIQVAMEKLDELEKNALSFKKTFKSNAAAKIKQLATFVAQEA